MRIKAFWLVAALALVAGVGGGVAHAQPDWCSQCNQQTGEPCFACCRCAGGSQQACLIACGDPLVGGKQATGDLTPLAAAPMDCPAADPEQIQPALDAEPTLDAVPASAA